MNDQFQRLRMLSKARRDAKFEWEQEVRYLRATGLSLRAIADNAGVSHDTIWKLT